MTINRIHCDLARLHLLHKACWVDCSQGIPDWTVHVVPARDHATFRVKLYNILLADTETLTELYDTGTTVIASNCHQTTLLMNLETRYRSFMVNNTFCKVLMQGKLFQRCTHFLYCSVLSLGGKVNTRRMLQPDMEYIFTKITYEIFWT